MRDQHHPEDRQASVELASSLHAHSKNAWAYNPQFAILFPVRVQGRKPLTLSQREVTRRRLVFSLQQARLRRYWENVRPALQRLLWSERRITREITDMEEELVSETEQARWYDNGMGSSFPKDYRCLLVEKKDDGYREYVLFYKGQPIHASQNFESIAVRVDINEKISRP